MGSNSYLGRSKLGVNKDKSASSIASDKDIAARLKRGKIRRPSKGDYGTKRIPDYTELAYKEAVSKLRYFLSGNYSPSIRSYGGSASIKNLDESDGDVEKKYYPSAVAEFRTRPRLTAKYTTLYADSLKSYNPAGNVNLASKAGAPQPPPADLSSSTNPDVIHFIQKQEEYIEQLERESQYCRDELNNLLGKVKEVISENENLHEAQKNKLISKMFSYAGSETDDLDDIGDSTGIDSDHKQSPTKTRPKSRARSTRLEGPNIVFESRISELEAQLAQSKIDLKKVQDENNEYKRKLAAGLVDNTCLDGFKRQIDNLQRDKSSLEAQISKLKMAIEKDGDGKYKRGYDVIEQQLRDERNNLEAELRRLKDDLAKERSKIRELAGEGARRAIQERSAAEERYNAHFDELSHDLAAQYDNVSKLQLELERQRREENELKRELSMKNSAIEDLKMELKNKCSSLQADLSQAHAEKASIEEELASARLALERQQRQAKHETNRLNSEIQSLRQRLDRADADLVHSRRENLRLAEQIASLEKEINMRNLTPMSPEKNRKEKEFSSMLENMENKHAKTVSELESMIHSQNSLMEKLTGECRLLTDKLDDANHRHKQSAESRPIRRTNQNTARPFKIRRATNNELSVPQAPLRKRVRTELGTLYRQVEQLSKTVQQTNAPDNDYQAQTTHSAFAHEDKYSQPRTGPEYPTDTRQPSISRQQSVTEFSENRGHVNPQPLMSRQSSKASIVSKTQEPEPETIYQEKQELKEVKAITDDLGKLETRDASEEQPNYEQNYDQEQYNLNFTQEYVEPNQYGNQGYDQQNYDQNYTQEQYPADYDYTSQQYEQNNVQYSDYVDPKQSNAQYSDYVDTNYEGTADPNYTQSSNVDYVQNPDLNYTENVDLKLTQDANAFYDQNSQNYTQNIENTNEANDLANIVKNNGNQQVSKTEKVAQDKTNQQIKETVQEIKKTNSPTQKKLRS